MVLKVWFHKNISFKNSNVITHSLSSKTAFKISYDEKFLKIDLFIRIWSQTWATLKRTTLGRKKTGIRCLNWAYHNQGKILKKKESPRPNNVFLTLLNFRSRFYQTNRSSKNVHRWILLRRLCHLFLPSNWANVIEQFTPVTYPLARWASEVTRWMLPLRCILKSG